MRHLCLLVVLFAVLCAIAGCGHTEVVIEGNFKETIAQRVGDTIYLHPFEEQAALRVKVSSPCVKYTKCMESIGVVEFKAISPGYAEIEVSMVSPDGTPMRHLPALYKVLVSK